MEKLPDIDLVKIGLASMVILHKRATDFVEEPSGEASPSG